MSFALSRSRRPRAAVAWRTACESQTAWLNCAVREYGVHVGCRLSRTCITQSPLNLLRRVRMEQERAKLGGFLTPGKVDAPWQKHTDELTSVADCAGGALGAVACRGGRRHANAPVGPAPSPRCSSMRLAPGSAPPSRASRRRSAVASTAASRSRRALMPSCWQARGVGGRKRPYMVKGLAACPPTPWCLAQVPQPHKPFVQRRMGRTASRQSRY